MTQMIFVNLPVADLEKSKAFYSAIGFTNEPKFTDETAAAMQLSDAIVVMLLTHDKWKQFTSKAIPNAKESAQVMNALGRDSREAVDTMVEQVKAAGGQVTREAGPVAGGTTVIAFVTDPDGYKIELIQRGDDAGGGQGLR